MSYRRNVIDEWRCDADGCLAIHSEAHAVGLGATPRAVESLPIGWCALAVNSEGRDTVRYFCPVHRVSSQPTGV